MRNLFIIIIGFILNFCIGFLRNGEIINILMYNVVVWILLIFELIFFCLKIIVMVGKSIFCDKFEIVIILIII